MEEKHCDMIIIGTGPAGLSAAIYCQRQGMSATVFGDTPGGNLYMIESVKNYPGFHEGVPGMQLGVFMYTQAQLEGANFTATNVDSLEKNGERFVAKDTSGNIFAAPVALIAAGSTPKRLNVQNAALDGIHYCAMCDGPLYRGKDAVIIVVGAGERGGHLCVFLSKIAKKVILVDKAPILNMSASLQKAVAMAENVEVLLNTEVQAFIGEDELKGIQVSSPGGQSKRIVRGWAVSLYRLGSQCIDDSLSGCGNSGRVSENRCQTDDFLCRAFCGRGRSGFGPETDYYRLCGRSAGCHVCGRVSAVKTIAPEMVSFSTKTPS